MASPHPPAGSRAIKLSQGEIERRRIVYRAKRVLAVLAIGEGTTFPLPSRGVDSFGRRELARAIGITAHYLFGTGGYRMLTIGDHLIVTRRGGRRS